MGIGIKISASRIVDRLGDENVDNGFFTTDTSGWAGSGITIARETDFNGVATSLKCTMSAVLGQVRQTTMVGSMANGPIYRNYIRVYIPSSNTTTDGIRFRYSNNYQFATGILTPTADTWTDYQIDFDSIDTSDGLYLYPYGGEANNANTVGDVLYITAISIRKRQ